MSKLKVNKIEAYSEDGTVKILSPFVFEGATSFAEDATFDKSVEVTGNVTVNGNLILGNEDTDTVQIGADIVSNLMPNATTDSLNIGSSAKKWNDIWLGNNAFVDNKIGVGTGSPDFRLQVEGDAGAGTGATIAIREVADSIDGPDLKFQKSKNFSPVENEDYLGNIQFYGHDGTDYNTLGCGISGRVDGTPDGDDVPGELEFYTRAEGGSVTNKMKIRASGKIGIGTDNPEYQLHVNINDEVGADITYGQRISHHVEEGYTPAINFGTGLEFAMQTDSSSVSVPAARITSQWISPVTGLEKSKLTFWTRNSTSLIPRMNIDEDGNVTISGDLTVEGTTTTINSAEITVDDPNITLNATISPTDSSADGGGITLRGDTDKTLAWSSGDNLWHINPGLAVTGGNLTVNTDTLVVDTTNNSVGIGTTSPGAPLDFSITQNEDKIHLGASDVGLAQKDGTDMVLFANTGGEVLFARGGRTGYVKMAVDMDAGGVSIGHNVHSNTPPTSGLYVEGKVGIGTTNPSHMLQVDSIADVEGLQVNGAENQYTASFRANTTTGKAYGPYICGGTNASDSALVVDNADGTSNYFKIRGDGNVGIGTDTPGSTLHVNGVITAAGQVKGVATPTDLTDAATKDYVDTEIASAVSDDNLDVSADIGASFTLDLDTQGLEIAGGTGVATTADGVNTSVTIETDSDQSHVTEVGTLTSLDVGGSVSFAIITVDQISHNLGAGDYTILGDTATAGADITVNLPDPSLCPGRLYNIKKISGTDDVILNPTVGTVDGAATKIISAMWVAVTIQSDGSNWYII